ncbi:MAG: small subunit ribosomal protein S1, partial [Nonlabens sp.]
MAEETNKQELEAAKDVASDTQVQEQVEQAPAQPTSPQQVDPTEFLDTFDWERYSEGIEKVDEAQLKAFEKLVSDNFVDTIDTDVIEGIVIKITDRDAIIDINAKSEGV